MTITALSVVVGHMIKMMLRSGVLRHTCLQLTLATLNSNSTNQLSCYGKFFTFYKIRYAKCICPEVKIRSYDWRVELLMCQNESVVCHFIRLLFSWHKRQDTHIFPGCQSSVLEIRQCHHRRQKLRHRETRKTEQQAQDERKCCLPCWKACCM